MSSLADSHDHSIRQGNHDINLTNQGIVSASRTDYEGIKPETQHGLNEEMPKAYVPANQIHATPGFRKMSGDYVYEAYYLRQ